MTLCPTSRPCRTFRRRRPCSAAQLSDPCQLDSSLMRGVIRLPVLKASNPDGKRSKSEYGGQKNPLTSSTGRSRPIRARVRKCRGTTNRYCTWSHFALFLEPQRGNESSQNGVLKKACILHLAIAWLVSCTPHHLLDQSENAPSIKEGRCRKELFPWRCCCMRTSFCQPAVAELRRHARHRALTSSRRVQKSTLKPGAPLQDSPFLPHAHSLRFPIS